MTGACQIPGKDADPGATRSHPPAQPEPLVRWWREPFLDRRGVCLTFWLVLAGLCLARAYAGLSGIQTYSHDAFGVLDGAWRVLHGQTPHADFYTPLGPIIYLVTALGLVISHGGAEGHGYSQAIAGMLLAAWAYRLARPRSGHFAAILLCLLLVLVAINPSSVGEPPINTSCMAYNRYGYVLVALLLLESIDPTGRAAGASTGAILALLLFLKISYFVGASALLAALIPCRRQSRDRWAGIVCGFLAVFLAFWAYLDFKLIPMWNDLRMVAGAKSPRMSWFIVGNLYPWVAFYLAFIWAACRHLAAGGDRESARVVGLAGISILLTGIFLLATNFQFYGLPLNAVMAILVLDRICTRPAVPSAARWKPAALLACGGLFVAGIVGFEALGLGFAVYGRQVWAEEPHSTFNSPVLAGFRSFDRPYVDLVNDGLALVAEHRRPGDTIMSLDFSNPFSYALGMPPAEGGSITLHYRGNFTDAHHPAPDRLLGHADLVMVAIVPTEPGLAKSIPRIYGPYLAAHFSLIGESRGWRLYRHAS
ncbi:MAG TPA: hypothetical protein VMS37_21810 [Verrucomicrobiae bacterium]|nr:hypothetical protein [Verrucomicrobiae bacterium]